MGGGSWLIIVCMTMLGPPAEVLVVVWPGVDMGPLLITKPKNGSGFAPAMGLDGVVCKSRSDCMILSLNERLCGLLMV